MKYTFKSENGCCPKCIAFGREYYIQDRYLGGDKYEYALMSKPLVTAEPVHYKDVCEMLSNLLGTVITDNVTADLLLSQRTICRSASFRMLEQNGKKFVWNEMQNELREYTDPKQETGYCDSYRECLNMAKEILEKKEREENGVHVSFLGL
ncbi:MAG: hypothetical protein PUJ62_06875 [Lachnospiraceae bacterium]|nr:hypothetical protein [Lachnospiraceae bacterium]